MLKTENRGKFSTKTPPPRWANDFSFNNEITIFGLTTFLFITLGMAIFSPLPSYPTYADTSAVSDISLEVPSACTISVVGNEHITNIPSGNLKTVGDGSIFTISCNDQGGYVVYAVGDTNDEEGNNMLTGTKNNNQIATGLSTEGDTSNWFFQLSNARGLTINSGFSENALIPSSRQAVASRTSGTSSAEGDSFTVNYSVYVSPIQPADSYSGKVKYILFHPSTANAEGEVPVPPTTMQEFGDYCESMTTDQVITLTDSRDNKQYRVAKLKDNKCWMIDNLRITDKNISSTDSDMTSGSFSIPAATTASTFQTSNDNVNNSKAYVDSYGGLYTWYTATAGTGNSSITSGGVNASGSICPKGWKLPSSDSSSSGDFANLVTAYGGNNSTGSTNLRATPIPGFTYAGYVNYNDGLPDNQGNNGYYWSSTSYNNTIVYNLSLYSSYADPTGTRNRVDGSSVRCLAR